MTVLSRIFSTKFFFEARLIRLANGDSPVSEHVKLPFPIADAICRQEFLLNKAPARHGFPCHRSTAEPREFRKITRRRAVVFAARKSLIDDVREPDASSLPTMPVLISIEKRAVGY